jgi:hypothetical protein
VRAQRNTEQVTDHVVTLTGLQANSRYILKVSSSAGGNTSTSGNLQLSTLATTVTAEAENSIDVSYGGTWSYTANTNASAAGYEYSVDTTTPATLRLKFAGTGVNIKYTVLPDGGQGRLLPGWFGKQVRYHRLLRCIRSLWTIGQCVWPDIWFTHP